GGRRRRRFGGMGAIDGREGSSPRYREGRLTAGPFAPCGCTDLELTIYGVSNYGGLVRFEQSRRLSGPLVEEASGANEGPQERDHRNVPNPRQRYRVSGSAGCASQRPHQLPHRALQSSREGSSLAPWPAQAGRPAPASARLSEEQGLRSL